MVPCFVTSTATLWIIWKSKNSVVFHYEFPPPPSVVVNESVNDIFL